MSTPILPLTPSSADGFAMTDDLKELINQNLLVLIMTNPGERIMYPDFGVGLKTYLFERYGSDVESQIKTKIISQVNTYLPPVRILDIQFSSTPEDRDYNKLGIQIKYAVAAVGISDMLTVFV
jgi:hypothetical protein